MKVTLKKVSLLAFLLALWLMYLPVGAKADDDNDDCDGVTMLLPLKTLNASGVTGSATLCIGESGVRAHLAAENLTAGNAYTVWFVYFDDPTKCITPGACTPTDTVSPLANPEGVFGRLASTVPQESEAAISGSVGGMLLSHGSEVHVPIFTHGPANQIDGRLRARQLLTPQNPNLGAPGLGTSSDGVKGKPVAVAVFSIP